MEAIAGPKWQCTAGRRHRGGPSLPPPSAAARAAAKWGAELSFTRKTKPQGRQWTPAVPRLLGHMYIWARLQPLSQADPPTAFHKRLLAHSRWRRLDQDGGRPGGWSWGSFGCSCRGPHPGPHPRPRCGSAPCFPQLTSEDPQVCPVHCQRFTRWSEVERRCTFF